VAKCPRLPTLAARRPEIALQLAESSPEIICLMRLIRLLGLKLEVILSSEENTYATRQATFHEFRNNYATRLLERCSDIVRLQHLMGQGEPRRLTTI